VQRHADATVRKGLAAVSEAVNRRPVGTPREKSNLPPSAGRLLTEEAIEGFGVPCLPPLGEGTADHDGEQACPQPHLPLVQLREVRDRRRHCGEAGRRIAARPAE
jgi:hypothetical protein